MPLALYIIRHSTHVVNETVMRADLAHWPERGAGVRNGEAYPGRNGGGELGTEKLLPQGEVTAWNMCPVNRARMRATSFMRRAQGSGTRC